MATAVSAKKPGLNTVKMSGWGMWRVSVILSMDRLAPMAMDESATPKLIDTCRQALKTVFTEPMSDLEKPITLKA